MNILHINIFPYEASVEITVVDCVRNFIFHMCALWLYAKMQV